MPATHQDDSYRPWMKFVLLAAAIYNLLWGTWVIVRPYDWFAWTGIQPPIYLGLWQCVGMIVGVYGVGYAIAAFDPLRHWPIVLVGLLGKVLGPIGMVHNLLAIPAGAPGRLPASWLWLNLTNDLIWWLPFAAILLAAFRTWSAPKDQPKLSLENANQRFESQHGNSLSELSQQRDVLVVFLRHRGCTFCRQTLADLATRRTEIEQARTIVLVHMGMESEETRAYFASYGLEDVHRISDPECVLYRAYDLERGRASLMLSPTVWWRGFKAAIWSGHGFGRMIGDGFQMPGAFWIRNNEIIRAYRHETPADRPDLCQLA